VSIREIGEWILGGRYALDESPEGRDRGPRTDVGGRCPRPEDGGQKTEDGEP